MKYWILAALLAAAPLAACATSATITQAPLSDGTGREFEGSFATVREAARATIQSDLPVTLRGVEEREGAYIFNIEIGVNAFSWGEIGRVVVMPVDADTTRVIVRSEKRSQMQLSGHGERDLAQRTFTGVESRLR
jgi:hypothetical protein